MCYAGFSERWMQNALKSVEVIKGSGTSDRGEKKAQVEPLSTGGVGMVHPPKGKGVSLPGSPLVMPFVPDHLGGKVLVEEVMILCTVSIRLEPPSKCGSLVCRSIHHILEVACIRVEGDWLLIGEVNHKANNGGLMLLHRKHIQMPVSFTAANIA
jgi:hypothetical protein